MIREIKHCQKTYWDKEMGKYAYCGGKLVKDREEKIVCLMCQSRRMKREMDKRFFSHRTNKDLILDLSL